jgi:hypothetical protein
LSIVPKTEAIAVAVLDIEVAAAVWLVTNVSRDLHAFRLELRIQDVRIVDPDVRIPGSALRID